jgi:hypothetical protein
MTSALGLGRVKTALRWVNAGIATGTAARPFRLQRHYIELLAVFFNGIGQ